MASQRAGRHFMATLDRGGTMAGMMTVSERDLRVLTRLINGPDDPEGPEPLPWSLFLGLHELIGFDCLAAILLDSEQHALGFGQQLGDPNLSEVEFELLG